VSGCSWGPSSLPALLLLSSRRRDHRARREYRNSWWYLTTLWRREEDRRTRKPIQGDLNPRSVRRAGEEREYRAVSLGAPHGPYVLLLRGRDSMSRTNSQLLRFFSPFSLLLFFIILLGLTTSLQIRKMQLLTKCTFRPGHGDADCQCICYVVVINTLMHDVSVSAANGYGAN